MSAQVNSLGDDSVNYMNIFYSFGQDWFFSEMDFNGESWNYTIPSPENAAFTYIIDLKEEIWSAFSPYFNASVSEAARLNFKNEEIMLEVHAYEDLLLYREKIKEHITRNSEKEINPSQRIIIGESLSEKYNILVDDTLKIEDIVNINIVSGYFKIKSFIP